MAATFAVMMTCAWASLEMDANYGGFVLAKAQVKTPYPGCVGFIPVFETREIAEAWRAEFGVEDAEVMELATKREVLA
jgi:hypothetical protein